MLEAQSIPTHRAPRSPQQRFMAIAIVATFHIAVVVAILLALNKTFDIPKVTGDITAIPVSDKQHHTAPIDPGPIVLVRPTTDNPQPPPVPIDQNPQGRNITDVPPYPGPTPHPETFTEVRAIAATHTIPAYPPIDTRLGHEGNVMLKLSIDQSGAVADAVVERSSGFDGLDRAAADWVKAHWRYAPATRDGAAIASTVEVTVTFRLTRG